MYSYNIIYDWQKHTLLIVEDDYSTVFYLKEILKDTGINIEIADDGEQAINICKNNPAIEIVLMDMQLPFMNGQEASIAIKKICPYLPIIAQTAFIMPYDFDNCLVAGCADYVTKPIDSYELLEKISKYLPQK